MRVGTLDLVHVTCLARGFAAVEAGDWPRAAIARRIEEYRSHDGAYNVTRGAERGSAYGCFLALGAYEDMDIPLPDGDAMIRCIRELRTDDGGYANYYDMPLGLTPATAAAIVVLRGLGEKVEGTAGEWLLARCHNGGFFAAPEAPVPDLLSTATALHALWTMGMRVDGIREACLDFVDSLWSPKGGFHGNWGDNLLDCEYTYYGLLALGHLTL